jgi:hypothetical protein
LHLVAPIMTPQQPCGHLRVNEGFVSIRARVPAIAGSIEVPAALRPELGLTR